VFRAFGREHLTSNFIGFATACTGFTSLPMKLNCLLASSKTLWVSSREFYALNLLVSENVFSKGSFIYTSEILIFCFRFLRKIHLM